MRVLPRVATLVIALCLLGVTGCAQMDKALGQRQALVSFKDGTSVSVRLQVRAACGKLPNVSPAPIPSGVPLMSAVSEVVYQIDQNASDADIARLNECLNKFPSVEGMDLQDSTDDSLSPPGDGPPVPPQRGTVRPPFTLWAPWPPGSSDPAAVTSLAGDVSYFPGRVYGAYLSN